MNGMNECMDKWLNDDHDDDDDDDDDGGDAEDDQKWYLWKNARVGAVVFW